MVLVGGPLTTGKVWFLDLKIGLKCHFFSLADPNIGRQTLL